jgi:medium-chain acyl-[acyl-carrier-protein] hydrolase
MPDDHAPIHALPDGEFLDQIRSLNGMSPQLLENQELMQMLLPILRADFAMCETYDFADDRPLDCPIGAFGGLEDPYIDRTGLEAWGEETSSTCSVRMFPGDHFYLNTSRAFLLRAIAQELIQSVSGVRIRSYL